MDIGTNTEIVLHKPHEKYLTSASCASGPAFEGAHIRDGMRASTGAIEAVLITPADIKYKTIGDAPAVGLCGSGIVDIVAEMYRHQIDRSVAGGSCVMRRMCARPIMVSRCCW